MKFHSQSTWFSYLPEQMTEHEVRKVVKEVVLQLGASSLTDMGKCMGILIGKLSGNRWKALNFSISKRGIVLIDIRK